MKEEKIVLSLNVSSTEELADKDLCLRNAAIDAAKNAYAPYSGFSVGVAVLLENGTIVKGNNQENAVYPSGLCAERVALFSVGASYPDMPVVSIAIIALKGDDILSSISPCGGCRQVMLETEQRYGRPVRVLLCGNNETVIVDSAKDLLPLCFGKDNLFYDTTLF